jgi:hypothetical protein
MRFTKESPGALGEGRSSLYSCRRFGELGGSVTTDGNALPNRDPSDVTRFRSAAARRLQAHRRGLRCLTVRVSKDQVRRLISNGYLSLESSEEAAYVAFALEAWISDNLT